MKEEKYLDMIIMILALILVVFYGIQIKNDPIVNYILGVMWSVIATLRFNIMMMKR